MKPKLLIADDSLFMRLIIKRAFENKNIEIIEAQNGKEAFELYKKHHPKVMTMDITMPVMDGVEALKKIVEYDKNANVIICSSMIYQENITEVLGFGAKEFVLKPFKNEELVKIVEKYL